MLVEKILEPGEELPADWATAGTTGYDALALVDRVLTDPAGEAPLTALEDRLRGATVDWEQMVHDNKRAVADGILHSEVRRIAREVARDLEARDESADEDAVADAIGELLACFPVYRSYLPEGREHLDQAFAARARRTRPDLAATLDVLEPRAARRVEPAGPALPADLRHGDGQGRRGLRVLPLVAAHLAQRGRRRPVGLRGRRRRLPRGDGRAPARLAATR